MVPQEIKNKCQMYPLPLELHWEEETTPIGSQVTTLAYGSVRAIWLHMPSGPETLVCLRLLREWNQ